MAVDTGGRKRWYGLVGEFDSEKEKHHMRCYYIWLLFQGKKIKERSG